jgi:uncharacterized protein (DUF305 family)
MKCLALSLCVAAALSLPVAAQDHAGHGMSGGDSPATEAFKAANMRMHEAMDLDYSGDADVDFVRGMIPHHQSAVEMAQIVLEHGSDPEIKALAEKIIADQEGEIAQMQEWLAKHGH